MYPVLFDIPFIEGLRINTYGVMVALGFLAAMWWMQREARRLGEDPNLAADLVFYCIIGGLVGGRITHTIVAAREQFMADPLSFFRVWEGGLVFYGGVISALLVAIIFARKYRLSFLRIADMSTPAIVLGHAFGRIGCLFAGCCFGRPAPSDAWYAITFPADPMGFAPAGIALYPTQLMEAAVLFGFFGLFVWLRKKLRRDGQLFALYLALYAGARFSIELFRGDVERGSWFGTALSTSQGIGLLMLGYAGVIWYVSRRGKQ